MLVGRACRVSPQACGAVPTSKRRTDIVVLLEQTKQACQCTLPSVSGKGDTDEEARKNAEELMTNVAKKFATGSGERSDLFSKEAVANCPMKLPMTLLTRPRKKYALHGGDE